MKSIQLYYWQFPNRLSSPQLLTKTKTNVAFIYLLEIFLSCIPDQCPSHVTYNSKSLQTINNTTKKLKTFNLTPYDKNEEL